MINTIWYLFKICLVLGVATYLATLPGELVLEWGQYRMAVQMGFVAVAAFLGFLAMVFASGLAYRIVSFPSSFMRYRQHRRHAKGYQALLRSLTAAATGDQKNARYLAVRAQKLLPESEAGLPLLLQAQAMRDLGDGATKDEPYQLLLKNAETALLGLHGLTQNAILDGDFAKALLLAREAIKKYPKNYALLKTVYDLEVRNRLWNDALLTLDQAVKRKVIPKETAAHDRAAVCVVLGDMATEGGRAGETLALYQKAVDVDNIFVPAVARLARAYLSAGERKKALSVVSKSWKKAAHPDLIPLWMEVMPSPRVGEIAPHYKWFESLAKSHPDSPCVVLGLAKAAIQDGLWGDARVALARAEKLGPTEELYRLWVLLEEKTENRAEVIRQWLDRAYTAPKSSSWVCSKTGRVFSEWRAIVEPEGLFNTLVWAKIQSSDPALMLAA
ncbi:MAG TPA: heme biosynthesis HemY N-terminal domain-containing protein [Alphaproteobacteria bacterium]|nr:heme biosynthesis HemY N-terminal domain-containing protein [Alphaproteobacteria bacterium]HNS43907.1 heme biosynthesis HemY N-terminal domain-containing protein [Alphaproteobacteria bacterium]